ncbi:MAG: hypothetical protein J6A01_09495 [Proteobacteria bacterium]|nr:hypothetical protein [Pseudomonadota bacterium]
MHRLSNLGIFLLISFFCFVCCSVGVMAGFPNLAVALGMLLVLVMTCGFYYATLHLQKVH